MVFPLFAGIINMKKFDFRTSFQNDRVYGQMVGLTIFFQTRHRTVQRPLHTTQRAGTMLELGPAALERGDERSGPDPSAGAFQRNFVLPLLENRVAQDCNDLLLEPCIPQNLDIDVSSVPMFTKVTDREGFDMRIPVKRGGYDVEIKNMALHGGARRLASFLFRCMRSYAGEQE